MKKYKHASIILAAHLLTLTVAVWPILSWAGKGHHDNNDDETPFSEAHIFFELNDTDGDLGIHSLIDGDAWKKLEIRDPEEHKILKIDVKGALRQQGLTEIFFESAEPTFDELDPADFFARFPEGEYEVKGKTLDGEELESEVEVVHTMPAPPDLSVNGENAAEQCDDEEPGYDATEVEASGASCRRCP